MSEWKYSGIKRRDFRNTRGEPEIPRHRKKAKKIKAKRRCYANVIDRANPENGPLVVGFGQTVEEALVEMRKDEEDGGNFLHPVDGFDIKIARKGTTQFDTEYEVIKSTECPLSEDVAQVNEWIKGQHNL